jgi:hypothetical protein
LGILVRDDPTGQSQFLVVYYFITILPVNDRPTIFVKHNTNVVASGSTEEYTIAPHTNIIPIASVIDPDTPTGVISMTVQISISTADVGADLSAFDMNGDPYIITGSTPLTYTGSITQVNRTLQTLTFQSSGEGVSDISVIVNDNGATGNCPPGQSPQLDGSCPQIKELHILVTVTNGSPISSSLGIAASVGLGGFFIIGVAVTIIAVRKFKEKKTDSWKEFNEDNFKDFGQKNPLFEEETTSRTNPLYISSRESIELSNY